eukprot:scaffold89982_cov30-Phaeocystis_antarctica.AAC.1
MPARWSGEYCQSSVLASAVRRASKFGHAVTEAPLIASLGGGGGGSAASDDEAAAAAAGTVAGTAAAVDGRRLAAAIASLGGAGAVAGSAGAAGSAIVRAAGAVDGLAPPNSWSGLSSSSLSDISLRHAVGGFLESTGVDQTCRAVEGERSGRTRSRLMHCATLPGNLSSVKLARAVSWGGAGFAFSSLRFDRVHAL